MKRFEAAILGIGLILAASGAAMAETDTRERLPGGITRESDGFYQGGRRLPDNQSGSLPGVRSRDLYYSPRARYRRDSFFDRSAGRGYYDPYYEPAPRYAPRQRRDDRRRGRYIYDPAGGGVIIR
jgi:hypothetical protein